MVLTKLSQGTVTIRCHMCYGVTFSQWTDYHWHYESTHREESKFSENHAATIRTKAMAEPINTSGRTKRQIVEAGESVMKDSLIKGYAGKGIYD